jgi:hypothetical protein
VRRGDTVLYDCPNRLNFLEITLLSKFVGNSGKLYLPDYKKSNCLNQNSDLHQLSNIVFIPDTPKAYTQYPIVISTNEIKLKSEIDNGMLNNPPKAMFFSLNSILEEPKIIKKLTGLTELHLYKVRLNRTNCHARIEIAEPDGEPGFYQLIKGNVANSIGGEKPLLKEIGEYYQKHKAALPSPL